MDEPLYCSVCGKEDFCCGHSQEEQEASKEFCVIGGHRHTEKCPLDICGHGWTDEDWLEHDMKRL